MTAANDSAVGEKKVKPFKDLFNEERSTIDERKRGALKEDKIEPPVQHAGQPEIKDQLDNEPWVTRASEDFVGLALSGGGIRSATYNLGLLQALNGLKILKDVDYLATVSGGGYIGGWFSAMRNRHPQELYGKLVPNDERQGKSPEIRHLREFSKFLSPRAGIFEVVMWYGIVAILGGLVVGLASATAIIMALYFIWIILTYLLWVIPGWIVAPSIHPVIFAAVTSFALSAITFFWLFGFEKWWSVAKKQESHQSQCRGLEDLNGNASSSLNVLQWVWTIFFPTLLATGSWVFLTRFWPNIFDSPTSSSGIDFWSEWGPTDSLRAVPGQSLQAWIFTPAGAWAITVVVLLILRFIFSRRHDIQNRSPRRSAIERATARLVGGTLVWSIVVLLWLGGGAIRHNTLWPYLISIATATGGIFAWIRNWVARSLSKPLSPDRLDWLKPILPQLLAWITVGLGAMLVASLTIIGVEHFGFWLLLAPILVLFFAAWLLDPAVIGLHAFYRDRIARAYLGEPTLFVEPQRSDDFPLDKLNDQRPIHLICTTANGLQDDRLSSLGRCAKSAVLSGKGLSIGNCWRKWDKDRTIQMGAALTASAAAFNSNMGSISGKLGPAVTFLMTALNLRLGLWVPHPCSTIDTPSFPGRLYFREMFGRTSTRTPCPKTTTEGTPCDICTGIPTKPEIKSFLHLSDGAHFENLALYELVRRHCRYIIVSDCGADPEVKFDDLGNAVRRIREDFGVDIVIDLDSLKPNSSGISQQHMAVGTIHYDRDQDKGILLYFKSALTGDEPADVEQYKARNKAFPHESTDDQFYDEAQWEAYRRLGEHAAWAALDFVEGMNDAERFPHQVFTKARLEWYPGPADLKANVFAMTKQYAKLEREIRENASPGFRSEMFGEIQTLRSATPAAPTPTAPRPPPGKAPAPMPIQSLGTDEIEKTLSLLLQMIQFMEDVFNSCYLESYSGHPLNLGWFNLFQRWVYMPSFEAWWPIVQSLYGPELRSYISDRLYFTQNKPTDFRGTAIKVDPKKPEELAQVSWNEKFNQANIPTGAEFYAYYLDLTYPSLKTTVQVAVVPVVIANGVATWSSSHLLILPGLWDTELGAKFLKDLVSELQKMNVISFEVNLEATQSSDRAKQDFQTDIVEMYTAAGFILRYEHAAYVLRYN